MAILENRVRIPTFSSTLFFAVRQLLTFLRKSLAIILIFILCNTLYILPNERVNAILLEMTGYLLTKTVVLRTTVSDYFDSIKWKLSLPSDLAIENTLLKLKIQALQKLQNDYLLALEENKYLKQLLDIPNPDISAVTHAKLIHVNDNMLSKTAIIAAGTKHGVKVNQVVCNKNGLIGRVISISDNYAKLMLITDPDSRIPVTTVRNGHKGILASNGHQLKIIYLQDKHNIEQEDIIITSGDGSVYPSGIVVAKVQKTYKNEILLEPVADININSFVTIYPAIEEELIEKYHIDK